MIVTTEGSVEVWRSPDKQIKLWAVDVVTDTGERKRLKTYSGTIAQAGFHGQVFSYLDERGERFLKQGSKEVYRD